MDGRGLKQRFGQRVQSLREAKGYTQEQLADRIGRSVDTVSNIERGVNSTRIEVAHLIAVELGVRLPDLFAFESEAAERNVSQEAVRSLLDLLRECDEPTIRSLTDLVRVGLTLAVRP